MNAIISILTALLLLAGCGYKEGVVSGDAKAYLFFSGNVKGATVVVDDSEPFVIEAGRDHRYRVSTGKHRVKVIRDGVVIIERELYLGDGIAKEIAVH
ncbi:MAG: hypothetical protein JXK05_10910 [Campylobacterales bacterium]|nr:hypothetical protein [Campylobacterales bacterium]